MKLLVLRWNKFGDQGGAALLECLHNINELLLHKCNILHEMQAKIKSRAREKNVHVNFN